jgi:exodeoxyribonuclease VII small subunit
MESEKIESLSFEDGYARLEEVIQQLEEGDLSLGESVALYEEGMQLAEHCGRKLDDAELKVTQLLSAVAGEIDGDLRSDSLGKSQ